MAIYSSILPAKFHRQRSLVGYTQCGLKVGHDPRMTPPLTRSLYFAMQALFPSSHLAFIIRIYIKISHKILCCLFHAHLYFFLLNYYNRSKVRHKREVSQEVIWQIGKQRRGVTETQKNVYHIMILGDFRIIHDF